MKPYSNFLPMFSGNYGKSLRCPGMMFHNEFAAIGDYEFCSAIDIDVVV